MPSRPPTHILNYTPHCLHQFCVIPCNPNGLWHKQDFHSQNSKVEEADGGWKVHPFEDLQTKNSLTNISTSSISISYRFNNTALFTIILESAHETITQLFNANADHTLETGFEISILHWTTNDGNPHFQGCWQPRECGILIYMRGDVNGETAMDLTTNHSKLDESFLCLSRKTENWRYGGWALK